MKPQLYLIRGLPGSGKSTLSQRLAVQQFAADDYFMRNGKYEFDPSALPKAHAFCQANTERHLRSGENVSVANTFTQRWELEPYLNMAKACDAEVTVIDLYDAGLSFDELAQRNVHGVSAETIALMSSRYEHDWRSGNPTPPWERS